MSEAGVYTARGIGELHSLVHNLALEGFTIVAVLDTHNGDYHVVAQSRLMQLASSPSSPPPSKPKG